MIDIAGIKTYGGINGQPRTWTRLYLAAVSSLVLLSSIPIVLLCTHQPEHALVASGTVTVGAERTSLGPAPIVSTDGIPLTIERNMLPDGFSIAKNTEVVLTDGQASVVKAFGDYLAARGEWAVVTSGTRTSEGQLALIKERITEKGAAAKFPKLEEASILDTKIWLKAWRWLTARHVPINAPAPVPGENVRTSMHLQGLAIDLISNNLDHLRSMLANFSRSEYAGQAQLHITGIVREPGCVHINLG